MTERLNELAKQAWNLCPDPHGETTFDALNKFEQKFAELIVRECCEMMQGFTFEEIATKVIKKNFGVE